MMPAEQDESLLEVIKRQVRQLTHMIDDLLDLSRISRDKIQLRKENIDAAAVTRRAAGTLQPLIEERKHKLILDLVDQPLPLHVDATRIEQVVGNLLTNAAKYTPEGGEIRLSTVRENGEAVIRVRDTGIGIAADVLPHVFELFTQANSTLDRSQGGLGIGLSVARKLVELHGGTITARSAGTGRGSEFAIRLPLSETLADAERTTPLPPHLPSSKLRILIVEDNHDTALTEAMLLQAYGHEVTVAYDGLSGVEQAQQLQPDAMVVDIGLPGLSGYEVASRMRQSGSQATLIAVSGYGQLQDQERSRAAGFDVHLVKPVAAESLLSALGQVTSAKQSEV
jgi:CheY-like chemotaxis protein